MLRQRLKDLRRELVLKLHGSGSRATATAANALVDQPITPAWIEEGAPRARAFSAIVSADGTIQAGEWDCTAGRFSWTYFEDEIIRILEGEALIEIDGAFRSCRPGDTIFFPLGQTVRWNVPHYVRKAYFIRSPGRVVNFMRTFKVFGGVAATVASARLLSEPLLTALGGA